MPVQKQKLNVYTVMLIISLLAICVACLLLWLELRKWGSFPWYDTRGFTTSAIERPTDTLLAAVQLLRSACL